MQYVFKNHCSTFSRRRLAACAAAALWGGVMALPASAQVMMGSIAMWNTNYMLNQQIMEMANAPLFKKVALNEKDGRASRANAAPLSTTAYSPDAGMVEGAHAADLAAVYPPEARAKAEQVFRQLLKGYHQIERQFDIAPHDVGAAVAAFVAGSYMAYRDTGFPDEQFKPLVEQMRGIVARTPEFQRASNADKQAAYERMAMLGMFMATTQMALQQQPNAQVSANMRKAGKAYLETFLKTDADRLVMGEAGLHLR